MIVYLQSLMAPLVKPRTNCFEAIVNTMSNGMDAMR